MQERLRWLVFGFLLGFVFVVFRFFSNKHFAAFLFGHFLEEGGFHFVWGGALVKGSAGVFFRFLSQTEYLDAWFGWDLMFCCFFGASFSMVVF